MSEAIEKALAYLNALEIHGEKNCVLLAAAIQTLKKAKNEISKKEEKQA